MRTTLDLPDPLFKKLKVRAAMRGVSLKQLVEEIIDRGLNASQAASGDETGVARVLARAKKQSLALNVDRITREDMHERG